MCSFNIQISQTSLGGTPPSPECIHEEEVRNRKSNCPLADLVRRTFLFAQAVSFGFLGVFLSAGD